MNNRTNFVVMTALAAGIVALGGAIVFGEYFHSERPEKMGYEVQGVEAEGGAEAPKAVPIAVLLQKADPAKGATAFKACVSCHTIDPGGANGVGPNLNGVVGKPLAQHPGFAYSDALKAKGGTWTFDALNEWLISPRDFVKGTKMTFAGISDPQKRADVIAYLNSQGSNLPLPPPPAEGAAPADAKGDGAKPEEAKSAEGEAATGGNTALAAEPAANGAAAKPEEPAKH